jgi:hypothetical protein
MAASVALEDRDDQASELASSAAQELSQAQRQQWTDRLQQLARLHPSHASGLDRIRDTLASPASTSPAVQTDSAGQPDSGTRGP